MLFHRFHKGSRLFAGVAAIILVLSLAANAGAADAKKSRDWTPGNNDPSVGKLGAPSPGTAVNRNAAPPPPSAAPAVPKVDAEQPVIPSTGGPVPLSAAPRPDAHVEGAPAGQSGTAQTPPAEPGQVNTFLASHPFVSGLLAGLIGTDLGSVIYGGPMMGDETAAMLGFICRIGLVVLVAILAVRLVWGLIGGSRGDDDYTPRGPRREPSFRRSGDEGGRREPTLRAERPDYEDRRHRR